jgi:hypothetical protein
MDKRDPPADASRMMVSATCAATSASRTSREPRLSLEPRFERVDTAGVQRRQNAEQQPAEKRDRDRKTQYAAVQNEYA